MVKKKSDELVVARVVIHDTTKAKKLGAWLRHVAELIEREQKRGKLNKRFTATYYGSRS